MKIVSFENVDGRREGSNLVERCAMKSGLSMRQFGCLQIIFE